MTDTRMTISSDFRVKSTPRRSTKAAWSLYVKRRWPGVGGVKMAMAEWGLSEWEARSLFEGAPSVVTVDRINDHKNGGFGLALQILEIRFSTALSDYITKQAEEARDELVRWEIEERRLAELARACEQARGQSAGRRQGRRQDAGLG